METVHPSQYYPTQKSYTMTPIGAPSFLAAAAVATTHQHYQSLFSKSRQDLDLLSVRKNTYVFYPPSEVSKHLLAEAGFSYSGDNYTSHCHCCRLEIGKLNRGDDPMKIHRLKSPHCPFVQSSSSAQTDCECDEEEDCIDGGVESSPSSIETDGPLDNSISCNFAVDNASRCKQSLRNTKPKNLKKDSVLDKEALRKENEHLRSTITCRKCKNTKVQTLFLPCRHLVTCEACAELMDDCIMCNQKILGTVRTFLI